MSDYKLGTDLILSLNGKPMGYSATCKTSNSTETGERVTKERGEGRFKEKYVKSVSEQITTEGFEVTGSRTPYADLKKLMLEGTPVKLTYCFMGETAAYSGTYIITSLDLDATDTADNLLFLHCCLLSACNADKVECNIDFLTFADLLAPSDMQNFYADMASTATDSEKKETPETETPKTETPETETPQTETPQTETPET